MYSVPLLHTLLSITQARREHQFTLYRYGKVEIPLGPMNYMEKAVETSMASTFHLEKSNG